MSGLLFLQQPQPQRVLTGTAGRTHFDLLPHPILQTALLAALFLDLRDSGDSILCGIRWRGFKPEGLCP